jgi:hypothetical protein
MDMKRMLEEEREEMLRDKYIESEKAGFDVGDARHLQWVKEYAEAWRVGYNMRNLMDLGDGRKPDYFAIFLDEPSRKFLVDPLFPAVPSGWTMYCRHCTLSPGDPSSNPEVYEYIARNLGKKVELEVVSVGVAVEVIAVGVTGDFKSSNAIPHVTVAVPDGGKPGNSNFIKTWEPYSVGRKLIGVVDAFPSHFGWKH